ncbi:L-Ala-D/L-Glu epimerase [Maioricimonas rarisocia]|uniref:Dipeptide epimerase n=1 Tax=Maioricimonas rarisocia TaxID=2528026 RepID=A0A517Z2D1_9PLAN|nr:dipeptide epimerase [Maioricimonas rarisocia]QDU36632.1 L-Ala-D/L-Glu epimerase [Maioricimonas rarisocia]
MIIAELTAFHVRIPLRRPIRHASHTRTENDTLVVRCKLSTGEVGWGEGLPRPYVTGESMEDCLEILRQTRFRSQLDARIPSLTTAVDVLRNLRLETDGAGQRDCFGNSVRAAVELSVLDAVARFEGVPLSKVTEVAGEPSIREARDKVQYSTAIMSVKPLKRRMQALAYRLYGFRHCKLKVGAEGIDDAAVVRDCRCWMGQGIDLRIDANEAWSCQDLEARLSPLLPFGISSVEQPVPHGEVDGLAKCRERLEVPIMLDESLCSLADGQRAIDAGTCDLFNIRLSKCGGYLNSLELAALAQKSGVGYQLGCMVGETGVLSAAGRHFASSVGGIRWVEGSFDRYLIQEPLTDEDLTFGRGGWADALNGPGLGVRVATSRVRAAARREIPLIA